MSFHSRTVSKLPNHWWGGFVRDEADGVPVGRSRSGPERREALGLKGSPPVLGDHDAVLRERVVAERLLKKGHHVGLAASASIQTTPQGRRDRRDDGHSESRSTRS